VYDVVYENEVYPSRYYMNNPKYLWWKFEPLIPSGDVILQNGLIMNCIIGGEIVYDNVKIQLDIQIKYTICVVCR